MTKFVGVWIPTITVSGVVALATADDDPAKGEQVMTATVERVIDGDTVVLDSPAHVRLIGINTPAKDECGYREATAKLRRLVEGRTVSLPDPDGVDDIDKYDRLLLYVDRGDLDARYTLIEAGLAEARYDSEDGYDHHPRQEHYRAASAKVMSLCETRERDRDRLRGARRVADEVGIHERRGETTSHLLHRARTEPHRQRQVARAAARAERAAKRAAEQSRRKTGGSSSGGFIPPAGWTTDALTPGYSGCRQGYPGGLIDGVYV